MSLYELDRSERSGLSHLVTEKTELASRKEKLAQELAAETATLQSLKDVMRRLATWLDTLEGKLTAMNRLKFQADSIAQYRTGSMDADYLLDDLATTINSVKTILSQVKLKITDTASVRDEHMRVFMNVEKRLGEISEAIKEICGE